MKMRKAITIQESISINSNKEEVWNFTQNFENRKLWDKSILEYEVLEKKPTRVIWIKNKGGIRTKLKYKLYDKPHKTSLKMCETQSLLLRGGGGSWKYIEKDGMTEWIQTNTVIIKNDIVFFLLGWLIKKELKKSTKNSMKRAKILIEKN